MRTLDQISLDDDICHSHMVCTAALHNGVFILPDTDTDTETNTDTED